VAPKKLIYLARAFPAKTERNRNSMMTIIN